MAGAGYKLFNTGDVLTAAQVNTYLMEQTVMVFADAASRTTALTGVVSEGMISYLKDTNAVEVYNGSAWVASDDPNAIQNTIVDAKGDLITATAADTPARLAVGNNGDTLVADSSASQGLRWQGNFAAGKNSILNADFRMNQRAFTSTTTTGTYGFDRWRCNFTDGTSTYSAETFTPGAAPVVGYEAINFARIVSTGQTLTSASTALGQRIEDVRALAGQTVTLSFWAKASTGTPNISVELGQNFGSGGSSTVTGSVASGTVKKFAITSSWVRYSTVLTVPSISGKTIGTGSYLFLNLHSSAGSDLNTRTDSLGIQSVTIDYWGVQLEPGSVATAFQTATGTLAGELAACQRYYQRLTPDAATSSYVGFCDSTTLAVITVTFPNTMRVRPTALETSGTSSDYAIRAQGSATFDLTAGPTFSTSSVNHINFTATTAATLVAGDAVAFRLKTANTSYLGWSAEL